MPGILHCYFCEYQVGKVFRIACFSVARVGIFWRAKETQIVSSSPFNEDKIKIWTSSGTGFNLWVYEFCHPQ